MCVLILFCRLFSVCTELEVWDSLTLTQRSIARLLDDELGFMSPSSQPFVNDFAANSASVRAPSMTPWLAGSTTTENTSVSYQGSSSQSSMGSTSAGRSQNSRAAASSSSVSIFYVYFYCLLQMMMLRPFLVRLHD